MSKRTRAAAFGAATTALAAGLGAYLVFFRRQCLTWGAQADEVSRRLPGDELLPGAGIVATRAVTIDAPPAGGRAPGWSAGLTVAARATPEPSRLP